MEYLKQQMQEIGLIIKEDDVGNVYGILLGKDPALPSIVSALISIQSETQAHLMVLPA
ncbi:hypothetical protein [Budvicia aquatica]|uniref:hypothetical protein n=1 Tax=Budvicia aquatica TaxID=82979 RepID=UPI00141B8B3F|nr:hypothetical protein [Budvicia aquatica]